MRVELIHPVTVHFAIGLLTTGVALALIGAAARRQSMLSAGRWALWVGTGFGVLAVVTGLVAEERVPHGGAMHELLETHEVLAFVTLGVFAVVSAGWLVSVLGGKATSRVALHVLGLVGAVLILLTGYFGGEMVYNHGVAVFVNGVPAGAVAPAASQPAGPDAQDIDPSHDSGHHH